MSDDYWVWRLVWRVEEEIRIDLVVVAVYLGLKWRCQ